MDHRDMTPPSLTLQREAPLVRIWDLRLAQPNVSHLPTAAVHSLEHFLGSLLPEFDPRFILAAPMGCQTGFYIVTARVERGVVLRAVRGVLHQVQAATEVPLANNVECGWAENHSLRAAQEVAGWLLRRLT